MSKKSDDAWSKRYDFNPNARVTMPVMKVSGNSAKISSCYLTFIF
jgi:hypothetical protein